MLYLSLITVGLQIGFTYMRLVIDIGNTNSVLGLFENDNKLYSWRINTNPTSTSDEIRLYLHSLLDSVKLDLDDIHEIILASVVPNLSSMYAQLAKDLNLDRFLLVNCEHCANLSFEYPNKQEIGADRIANAVGAQEYYSLPAIVVDFGTATNIDVVSSSGSYLGGCIAPGIELSTKALISKAAKLSSIDLDVPAHAIGKSTSEALQAGIIFGAAGQIEGLVNRMQTELAKAGEGVAIVIATGGLATYISPVSDIFDVVDPDITVKGLNAIADISK